MGICSHQTYLPAMATLHHLQVITGAGNGLFIEPCSAPTPFLRWTSLTSWNSKKEQLPGEGDHHLPLSTMTRFSSASDSNKKQKFEEEFLRSGTTLGTGQLPEHVVHSILLFLPLKSLARFRCVSKEWYQIIGDRRFYKHYRKPSSIMISPFYTVIGDYIPCTAIGQVEGLRWEAANLWFPYELDFHDCSYTYSKIGSSACDGLTFVVKQKKNRPCTADIWIWNPFTHEHREFAWPRSITKDNGRNTRALFLGFGYDDGMEDYKIVVMTSFETHWEIQVTGLNANSWWRVVDGVESSAPCNLIRDNMKFETVTVAGDVYWISKEKKDQSKYVLLKFSLTEEKLTVVPFPQENLNEKEGRTGLRLGHYEGSLHLFYYAKDYKIPKGFTLVDVWKLEKHGTKEYWRNVLKVPKMGLRRDMKIKPVGFTCDGNFVSRITQHGFSSYIIKEDRFEKLQIDESQINKAYLADVYFIEMATLVSP